MAKFIFFLKSHLPETIILLASFFFSIWLMVHTFSYNKGSMLIAAKAWSDFSANIPLIRSFSFGDNFPPEYPIFPGLPIHYHFLFYLIVGILEKLHIRIDIALNSFSILGFTAMLFFIYLLAQRLFKSKSVAILSLIFFIFNGSLSFFYFFSAHPLSTKTISQIAANTRFPSFGPYDSGIVSAFWNLNIYTNQRHLAFAHAISLGILLVLLCYILKKTKPTLLVNIALGIILGLSFFLHMAVFLMTIVVLIGMFFLFKKLRLSIFSILAIASIITLPQYLYLRSRGPTFSLIFSPGYLIHNNLNTFTFLQYWIANLGLHFFIIPLGVIFAPKTARKLFFAILPVFFVGNLFQFSPEMAANHKFFSYFIIFGNMFSAYFLVKVWDKKIYLKPLAVILSFFLILSGIIDFFPVYNDTNIVLADYPNNPDISWIMKNTSPKAVFLNTSYLYDNASLAGRKIFMGWPYFAWSAGYDTNSRGREMALIFEANSKANACRLLEKNNIDYVEINKSSLGDPNLPPVSEVFHNQFSAVYINQSNTYSIYSVKTNCL